ncbi:hypothetical protein [Texcoconibacillus texcoconensis]|uniref:Uncharacterized protein n=1 Tax=Texcoconibacillus texcoconensis TaxID=1095777 RepID=A0A840QRT3_9BACI|nr:hypothetical protein [Texcoconibacillus texcoconensis]MBB5174196.1 hypothetical protein [Texcoconibacillus texcoconensis]
MEWFSFFLLSFPEVLLMLAVSFALLGISIKENLKSMIIFSLLYGGVSFTLNIYMMNSVKPLINLTVFALLVVIIFQFKMLHGFIISIIGFIFLVFFEIILLLPLTQIIPFEQIAASPWLRILAGIMTIHIPLLVTLLVIQRFKLVIKIPLLK